jgi:hypothetical protein
MWASPIRGQLRTLYTTRLYQSSIIGKECDAGDGRDQYQCGQDSPKDSHFSLLSEVL